MKPPDMTPCATTSSAAKPWWKWARTAHPGNDCASSCRSSNRQGGCETAATKRLATDAARRRSLAFLEELVQLFLDDRETLLGHADAIDVPAILRGDHLAIGRLFGAAQT